VAFSKKKKNREFAPQEMKNLVTSPLHRGVPARPGEENLWAEIHIKKRQSMATFEEKQKRFWVWVYRLQKRKFRKKTLIGKKKK